MSGNGSSSGIVELYKHVLSVKTTAIGGTRFVVRAVKFADNKVPYVSVSRQWLKADTDEWLPTKTGHIFLPIDVWKTLAANADQIDREIEQAVSDGSCGSRQGSERANERDAIGRAIPDDTDGATTGFYICDGTSSNGGSTSNATEQQHRGKNVRKAKANAYAGSVTLTAYSEGPSSKRDKCER
jgi:hypothetical protein